MVLMFQHASFNPFAPFEEGAFLSFFFVVRPLEKVPVDRG